ncbi:DUF1378 family protein [Enterobacter roggenkampii]|uniref:DUF1378 family protein n=1 Tax=Enterobacter roggenkampii TaxID=1812935 RepID=UPI0018C33AC6|nr:DUF1378 family protein [Enterobacter roggenkampii]MBG0694506.1 DUF1378 family protein [Enterobacter roggenkampii]
MTFFDSVLLYFSAVTSAFMLIAVGWVKMRDWFKAHALEKAEEAAAAAKAEADKVEELVQVRLKQIQADAAAAPASTATSTTGPVVS